ncbi:MAG: hypothetical protein Q4G09_02545 [Clostridia bacterium]|nr:hypothetical protein [Clostridia bacterium]
MKARRYQDIDSYKDEFIAFQENFNQKKKEYIDSKITEKELIEWLEKQK